MLPTTSTDHLRERRLARHDVFTGRMLTVALDDVALADGTESTREIVLHRGAVAIIPVTDGGEVVLVRQWRHPLERAYYELPAGTRETGEPASVTAERELAEETGYTASSWQDLGEAPVSPGYSTELLRFYRADGLSEGAQHMDEDERLDVVLCTADDLADLLARQEVDMKTIAGLALAGLLPERHG